MEFCYVKTFMDSAQISSNDQPAGRSNSNDAEK